ncbi:MAG: hypothetical protein ABSH20_13905 [Tepidisphaeraceae bacterium]|jgi:hypothetical protein
MDPIRPKFDTQTPRTDEVAPGSQPTGVSSSFEIESVSPEPAASPAAPAARPNYDQIQARIRQALEESQSPREALQKLVDQEVQRSYGPGVSPAMRQAITERFHDDPQLADLVGQLFSKAPSGAESAQ